MSLATDELAERWFRQALAAAQIERDKWHPARGVDENRRTIPVVYDYYGQLFLMHPFLEWAGMANLIGPALYAGFRELGFLPDLMRRAVAATFGRGSRRLAGQVADGIGGWYESTFLRMEKKVFEDQATLHQAYLDGGMSEIDEFYRARIIDAATRDAWRQIDTGRREGDMTLIGLGNRTLLFREQLDILGHFYVQMFRRHGPVGQLATYMMTLVGAPSVPGARAFGAQYPFVAWLPRTRVSVRTPLAGGNIALFADRWKLIEHDTLPNYLAFIHNSPQRASELVAKPVSERVWRYLLPAQACRLAGTVLTGWGLDARAARPPSLSPTRQLRPFDLTRAPTRESVGIAKGAGSKVWMDPRGRPFEVEISLPGDRSYHTRAELAVMFSGGGDEPDRLTVQLPPMGIDACGTRLNTLSGEWGFPADAAAAWHISAKHHESSDASSDRHYLTHVFTCRDAGFVHLEFQVAHHVRDREAVITALFSWPPGESR
jgi:hypothetical protein